MRIVSGSHAGRHLVSPGGRVRPTAEPVRDRWMTWMADEIRDARILEIFAGTGAVGLEALSRGAKWVDFVERAPEALHSLKANCAALRETKRTRIYKQDAVPFLEKVRPGRYDLILADPPYGSGVAQLALKLWKDGGLAPLFALEHDPDHEGLPRGLRSTHLEGTTITLYRL